MAIRTLYLSTVHYHLCAVKIYGTTVVGQEWHTQNYVFADPLTTNFSSMSNSLQLDA